MYREIYSHYPERTLKRAIAQTCLIHWPIRRSQTILTKGGVEGFTKPTELSKHLMKVIKADMKSGRLKWRGKQIKAWWLPIALWIAQQVVNWLIHRYTDEQSRKVICMEG